MNNDIRILSVKRPAPDLELTAFELGGQQGAAADVRFKEIFDTYKDDIRRRIVPRAAIGFGEGPDNEKLLFLVMSLGEPVVKYLDMPIISDDSYLAVVLNAMADSCLFVMEKSLEPAIKSICKEKGFGISQRISESYDNMRLACESVDAKRTVGVHVESGCMKPSKSLFIGYVLKENSDEFNIGHDCKSCSSLNCLMRRSTETIPCPSNVNILEYLNSQNIYVSTPCGGHGTCGKCRIRVIKGQLQETDEDRAFFTGEELSEGWRLACTAFTKEEITISISETYKADEKHVIEGLGDGERGDSKRENSERGDGEREDRERGDGEREDREREGGKRGDRKAHTDNTKRLGIAVDIGTTTIAAAIADMENGTVLKEASCLNHQNRFGADVISRISAGVSGKEDELMRCVNSDIEKLAKELITGAEGSPESVEEILVTGNSVMGHLLTGDDVSGFSKWPFRMAYRGWRTLKRRKLYENSVLDCAVTIVPSISAFVGADIAAGLIACEPENTVLFIDIGTNGEMVLHRNGRFLAASTAAGPAFEGGCISCGTGSVKGAISSVRIDDGKVSIKTLLNAPPSGICGTGIIEAASAMLKADIIDHTGKLEDKCKGRGYTLYEDPETCIRITQDDIRSIQLAKGAVRAGIDTLLYRAGISTADIDKVILAGGFGCRIDPKAACSIGLLPAELSDRTLSMGNTSLKGALQLLVNRKKREQLTQLLEKVTVCELSDDDYFADRFIKEMNFDR